MFQFSRRPPVVRCRCLWHHLAVGGGAHPAGRHGGRLCHGLRPADCGHIWNLGTWWLGLPASSSHTLIGSIIGVGVANALMRGLDGISGVDWTKATEIGYSLLLSPIFGFCMAAVLLLLLKFLVRKPELYAEPRGNAPPPWWIRGILILTCTRVSFAHGSNDGQKGMGLIMLILIGTVPIAYALNRAMPAEQMTPFVAMASATQQSISKFATVPAPADSRK